MSNVVKFTGKKARSVVNHGLIDDTLAVAEWAIGGVAEKLHDLTDEELGLLWDKAAKNFNAASEFDQVSDMLLMLVEDELESRGLDGGAA